MRRRKWDWQRWGKHLASLRDEKGWTQQTLADRIGAARVTVSRLENGTRRASVEFLSRLADAFGLSLDDLIKEARR